MKLKNATIDLIVNYLIDISKILFGGIIFSNIFMEKYFNKILIICGIIVSMILVIVAIILKEKEGR